MTKTDAMELNARRKEQCDNMRFWEHFTGVSDIEQIQDRDCQIIMWHDAKYAVPETGKRVLLTVCWNNQKTGVYIGKRVSNGLTDWVFDYDDKPIYSLSKKQYDSTVNYGTVMYWAYMETVK